jgi:hypothetical protein
MKTMTVLAAMLLLHACGSGPTTSNDAAAATANETLTAAPRGGHSAYGPRSGPGHIIHANGGFGG